MQVKTCLLIVSCFVVLQVTFGKPSTLRVARNILSYPTTIQTLESANGADLTTDLERIKRSPQIDGDSEEDGEGRHLLHRKKFKPHKHGILGCQKHYLHYDCGLGHGGLGHGGHHHHHGHGGGGILGGGGSFGFGGGFSGGLGGLGHRPQFGGLGYGPQFGGWNIFGKK